MRPSFTGVRVVRLYPTHPIPLVSGKSDKDNVTKINVNLGVFEYEDNQNSYSIHETENKKGFRLGPYSRIYFPKSNPSLRPLVSNPHALLRPFSSFGAPTLLLVTVVPVDSESGGPRWDPLTSLVRSLGGETHPVFDHTRGVTGGEWPDESNYRLLRGNKPVSYGDPSLYSLRWDVDRKFRPGFVTLVPWSLYLKKDFHVQIRINKLNWRCKKVWSYRWVSGLERKKERETT